MLRLRLRQGRRVMNETRKAALTVADRAHDAADCKQLLDMLGLIPDLMTEEPRDKRKHGTPYTYRTGCHCDQCTAAHTARCRERRANAAKDPARADRAGHGKASTYKNHGCRCDQCREANSASLAEWKRRKQVTA